MMVNLTPFAQRVAAAMGAATLSLVLIVSSFATPHAATFAGVLA